MDRQPQAGQAVPLPQMSDRRSPQIQIRAVRAKMMKLFRQLTKERTGTKKEKTFAISRRVKADPAYLDPDLQQALYES